MADDSIFQVIDRIAVALGQNDFAHMREKMGHAAPFLINLGRWAQAIAAMRPDEFQVLVETAEQKNGESAIRILTDLESTLPRFRIALVKKLGQLAPSLGGRPPQFRDRATERGFCQEILRLIGEGDAESTAVRKVAASARVALQTMQNTWDRRSILSELSAVELVDDVIAVLSSLTAPAPEEILLPRPDSEAR